MKKKYTKYLVLGISLVVLTTTTAFKKDYFEIAKQIEIFTTLFKEVHKNYVDPVNAAKLMETAIKEMLEDLDPYTKFLNEQDVEAYKIKNIGQYSGIGAAIRTKDNKLFIQEPYKGYPADKAGLKAGDQIIQIDNTVLKNTKQDYSELLRGPKNSSVKLVYLRNGKKQKTTLTRTEIAVDAVPFYSKIQDKTGYIVLSKFNKKASSQTKNALEDLLNQGVESIILDLRNNPGGLLSEAINVVNLFVPKNQLIVTTKSHIEKFNKTYVTKNKAVDTQIPVAVLINHGSASASEIVSGALQDLDRAVIIGNQSYGKGLVQRPLKLRYGTQVKVTISRYYTPSGRCIQAIDYKNRDAKGNATAITETHDFTTKNRRKVVDGNGITPDITLENTKDLKWLLKQIDHTTIFNFASQYEQNHTITSLTDFNFTTKDYQDFIAFSQKETTDNSNDLEKIITTKKFTDKVEKQGDAVKKQYELFLQSVENAGYDLLKTRQKTIQPLIEDEIIKRYFYQQGVYQYSLSKDIAIQKACAIVNDTKQYQSILNY